MEAMVGSTKVFLTAFSRTSVPYSRAHETAISGDVRRQHRATSPPLSGKKPLKRKPQPS